jgi:hypothetical protein
MVVFTRNTLQEQENHHRTLSSLRLHYFLLHYSRKMDPLTPYSQKIDLRTENGRKIYESCTKALPVIYDAVAGKHHVFLTTLKNAADERCWRDPLVIHLLHLIFLHNQEKFHSRICVLTVMLFGQELPLISYSSKLESI